ncbi:MAG: hypothetical protein U1F43_18150 [Myxococcota bacterium]
MTLTQWVFGLLGLQSVAACGEHVPVASPDQALLAEPRDSERARIVRALPTAGPEAMRVVALVDALLDEDAGNWTRDAVLRKLGQMSDPAAKAAADDALFRRAEAFDAPFERDLAIAQLARPGQDVDRMKALVVDCVSRRADPEEECNGFEKHLANMGEPAALMLGDLARSGDRVLAYYAATYACAGLAAYRSRAALAAVRDAVLAVDRHGDHDARMTRCIGLLQVAMPDAGLDARPRGPCRPAR